MPGQKRPRPVGPPRFRWVGQATPPAPSSATGLARTGAGGPQHVADDPTALAEQLRVAKVSPGVDPRTEGYLEEELSLATAKAGRSEGPGQERIFNESSGILHKPLVWARTVPPLAWRTQCGWPFGSGNSLWHARQAAEPGVRCKTCFRPNGPASSSSPGSTSSSSSSSPRSPGEC